jgi:hypothetical protein
MLAYEFYWCDGKGKDHLIGILPERRKTSERINQESVMNWLRMVIGNPEDIDSSSIYYLQVEM